MDRARSYRNWWHPLPIWLKLVTLLCIYPAWLFIAICVFSGASKSREALLVFGVFAIGTLLHIVFDRRAPGSIQEGGGVDVGGDE